MKYRTHIRRFAAAATTFALAFSANAATLIVGTEIGIDFGPTTPTNNMNMVGTVGATTWSDGSLAAGTMIDRNGTTVDNVGFSWTGTGAYKWQNDGSEFSSTIGLPFNDSNMTDWFGTSNESTANEPEYITLTFTGLNDAMTYNLVIGARYTVSDVADTMWTVDGQSLLSDTGSSNDYRFFEGLSTDGFGNLVISGTGHGSRLDLAAVSALQLTAIPEPTSAALIGGLGMLALLRRRRN